MSWISVEERLPKTPNQCERYKYSNDVLIFERNGFEQHKILVGSYCSTERSWSEQSGSKAEHVTHWQPLPAPPEEQR